MLNANYLLRRLQDHYDLPYHRRCMHEFVLSRPTAESARRARPWTSPSACIDYGFHPPTIYFPLIVEEAMMIEPTETESQETLDAFAEALLAIAREAGRNPEVVKVGAHTTVVGRLDEVAAARQPRLHW